MAQIAEKGRRPIVTRTVTFLLSLWKMCWRKQLCSTYNHRATSRLYTGLPSRDVRIHGEFLEGNRATSDIRNGRWWGTLRA
jgi:hypothetical protein